MNRTADGGDKCEWAEVFAREEQEQCLLLRFRPAGLSQYVLSSSNSTQVQQTLQTLQSNLASDDLSGAQSAFQSLQTLFQNSATANGTSTSANSQLSTDLTSLGSALSSGDLPTAQSAFTAVQNDLKSSSPTETSEINAADQSIQLVDSLLSTLPLNTAASTSPDLTTSLLESVYGNQSGLNVLA
ncbi:MAG: hypothetical protein WAM78_19720 [Candidatus Sulfotelmatobacter sp.]